MLEKTRGNSALAHTEIYNNNNNNNNNKFNFI